MKKKIIAVLTVIAMIAGLVPVQLYAAPADESILQTTINEQIKRPGEQLTVDLSMANQKLIAGMEFRVLFPAESLTLTNIELKNDELETIISSSSLPDDSGNRLLTFNAVGADPVTADGDLLTLTFEVKQDAEVGRKEIIITNFEAINMSDQLVDFTIHEEGFDLVKAIRALDVIVEEPVSGAEPQTTFETDRFVASIQWQLADGSNSSSPVKQFEHDTAYKAIIDISPIDYLTFEVADPTVNGLSADEIITNQSDRIVLGKTFAKTEPLPVLEGTPSISNDMPAFGDMLQAEHGIIGSDPGEIYYQWYRDDQKIDYAISDSYIVKADDIGAQLKVEVSAENYAGIIESLPTAAVDKAETNAQPIPAELSVTANSIIVVNVITGQEYGIASTFGADPDVWQTTGQFEALAPNTEYFVYTRFAATETNKPGPVIETSMTTDKLEQLISGPDNETIFINSQLDLASLFSSNAADASLSYAVANNTSAGTVLNNSVLSASGEVGEVIIRISAAETADYAAAADKIVAITIADKLAPQFAAGFTTELTKIYGDTSFTKAATLTAGDGAISYQSSDSAVATVDASSGEVVILTPGTTTITAKVAETDRYQAAEQSYQLVVQKADLVVEIVPTAIADYGTEVRNMTIDGGLVISLQTSKEVVGQWKFGDYDNVPNVGSTASYLANFVAAENPSYYNALSVQIVPVINGVTEDWGAIALDNSAPAFGDTLTASVTYNAGYQGDLTYQWYRDNEMINGQDGSAYAVVAADIGHAIKVVASSQNYLNTLEKTTNTVTKAEANALPTAVELTATADSITVTNVMPQQEYAITEEGNAPQATDWQKTGLFSNLAANKSYAVHTRIAETETHLASASSFVVIMTNKLEQVITGPTNLNLPVGGELNLEKLFTSNAPNAAIRFEEYSNTATDSSFTDNYLFAGNDTGVVVLKVNADEIADYSAAQELTLTVTIIDKENQVFDNGFTGVEDSVYGSQPFTKEAQLTAGNGQVVYSSNNQAVATVDANTGEVTIKGVGSAVITATASETPDYAEAMVNYTLNVAAKQLVLGSAKALDKDYDGNAQTTIAAGPLSGVVAGDDVALVSDSVAATMQQSDAAANIAVVADTPFELTGADKDNYTLLQPSNLTATIAKARLVLKTALKAAVDYGVVLQNANFTDGAVASSVTNSEVAGTWAFVGNTTMPNVGSTEVYTATFTPATGAANYQVLTTTVTPVINKVDYPTNLAETKVFVPSDYKFDDYSYQLTAIALPADFTNINYDTVTLADNSAELIANQPTLLNGALHMAINAKPSATSAVVNLTISSQNYNVVVKRIVFIAEDRTNVVINGVSVADKIYDGAAVQPAGAAQNAQGYTGAYIYHYSSTDGKGYDSENPPHEAGAYQLLISVPQMNQQYIGQSAPIPFTIQPKQVVVAPSSHSIFVADALPTPTVQYDGVLAQDVAKIDSLFTLESGDLAIAIKALDGIADLTNSNQAGTFKIVFANAPVFKALRNYSVVLADAELVINRQPADDDDDDDDDDDATVGTITTEPTNETITLEKGIAVQLREKLQADQNGLLTVPDDNTAILTLDSGQTFNLPSGTTLSEAGVITIGQGGVSGFALSDNTQIDLPGGSVISSDGMLTLPGGQTAQISTAGDLSLQLQENIVLLPDSTVPLGYQVMSKSDFVDVSQNAWYLAAVNFVKSHGLFKGTSTSPAKFSPDMAMNRAMLVTVLHRLSGGVIPNIDKVVFADVKQQDYFNHSVQWAVNKGIIKGYGNGLFGAYDNLTREQLVTIIYRFLKSLGKVDNDYSRVNSYFADSAQISGYSKAAAVFCAEKGIIKGKPGNRFDPKGIATRAEVAAILKRLIDYYISK